MSTPLAGVLILGAALAVASNPSAAQDPAAENGVAMQPLVAGAAIEGTLASDGAALVHSPSARKPLHGVAFTLVADEPGPRLIELRSFFFDPWLLLEDEAGAILAENDDGPVGRHARLVADLVEGRTYVVRACASYGGEGPFTLRVTHGAPAPDLEGKDLWNACLADARAAYTTLRDALPPENYQLRRAQGILALASVPHGVPWSIPQLTGSFSIARLDDQHGRHDDAVRTLVKALDALDIEDYEALQDAWISAAVGLCTILLDQGRQDEAAAWYARIQEVRGDLGRDPTSIHILEIGADIALARGDIDAAVTLQRRRVDLNRDAGGRFTFDCIEPARAIPAQLLGLARPDEAVATMDEIVGWLREEYGLEHPLTLAFGMQTTLIMYAAHRHRDIQRIVAEFLPVAERTLGDRHRVTIEFIWVSAEVARSRGHLERARDLLGTALARSRAADAAWRHHADEVGETLAAAWRSPERNLWDEVESSIDAVIGARQTSDILGSMADVLEGLGEADEALELLAEVSGDKDAIRPTLYGNLRLGYASRLAAAGDLTAAAGVCARLSEELERMLPAGADEWLLARFLEAELLRELGRNDESLRALDSLEAAFGTSFDRARRQDFASQRALSLAAAGRFQEAFALESSLGDSPVHDDGLVHQHNAGVLAQVLGLPEDAVARFEAALMPAPIHGREPTDPFFGHVRLHASFALKDAGRTHEAWQQAHDALRGSIDALRRELPLASEANRLAHAARHLEIQDGLLALVRAIGTPERERETFHAVAAFRGLVGRGLASGKRALFAALDDEGRASLEELRAVQSALSAATLTGSTTHDPAVLRERRRVLEQDLLRRGVATDVEVPDASRLGAELPAGSALLLFALHEDPPFAGEFGVDATTRLSAWVLRAGEADALRIDLGDAAPIEGAVRAHLARLGAVHGDAADLAARGMSVEAAAKGEGDVAAAPAGSADGATSRVRDLAHGLWHPLAAALDGADPVFVVPDGFLGALPFETIALDDGSFLLERTRFVYLDDPFDARAGDDAAASSPPLGRALCVADVAYGDAKDDGGAWSPLPGTAAEVAGILGVLQRADAARSTPRRDTSDADAPSPWLLLTGTAATKERLAREMPAFSILHLATHGFFDPRIDNAWDRAREQAAPDARKDVAHLALAARQLPGLACGLVCANANAEREKGLARLTADEVGWLDLRECQIAVLSACETGLGRSTTGQGMTSLRRAFHHAGARTVVSSSWRVDDEATATLMVAFYENLLERGMTRLDALQHARLSLLAANKDRFEDPLPHTWGAFVLSGEWR